MLTEIAPDEAPISKVFIDPLLDMVADGEVGEVGTSDEAGGFGTSDLMVMIIVPAVVSALTGVLTQAGVTSIVAFRWKRSQEKEIVFQIQNEVEAVIRMIKPKSVF